MAAFTIAANISHSGSISKSQWDLLFGSFQNMTASTGIDQKFSGQFGRRTIAPATDEHFHFGMRAYLESGTAEHRFRTSPIRNPPIGRISRVTFLNEIHGRKIWLCKNGRLGEWGIPCEIGYILAAPLHRLKDQQVARSMFVNQVKSQQGMTQVIE